MRHAIITCCDAKYGDFLIEHWLRSLAAHDNLSDGSIDVIVLDYGLTAGQLERLHAEMVRTHPCVRDGHLTNIRYRDMAAALRDSNYDQVLAIDGGDIIFQADIRPAFEQHKDQFRAVCEQFDAAMHVRLIGVQDFRPDVIQQILALLGDRPAINGGVVFGPAKKFVQLWNEFEHYCQTFSQYASDQLLISYLLYKEGFFPLDEGYNFALFNTRSKFCIKNGVFLDGAGKPIPIVHNNGEHDKSRMVANFGWGPGHNKLRWAWKETVFYSLLWHKFKQRTRRWLGLAN
jgi:hypothetical protein